MVVCELAEIGCHGNSLDGGVAEKHDKRGMFDIRLCKSFYTTPTCINCRCTRLKDVVTMVTNQLLLLREATCVRQSIKYRISPIIGRTRL